MKFASTIALLACVASAAAAAVNVEKKALPIGHPIIDGSFITQYNYTLRSDVYPSGFQIPTETLTNIPSGYSIGPTAVWGPDGAVVTAFPSEAIAQVIAPQGSTTPGASSSLSTGTVGATPSAAATTSRNGAFKAKVPAAALAIVAGLVYSLA